LASSKSKVEQELATLAGDYDEVTRELRVSSKRKSASKSEYWNIQCDIEELYTFKIIQKTYMAYIELHTHTS
jgi:hypothetical protein